VEIDWSVEQLSLSDRRRFWASLRGSEASAVDEYSEISLRRGLLPPNYDARTLAIITPPPKASSKCAADAAFAVAAAATAAITLSQPGVGREILQQGGLSPHQLHFCQSNQAAVCLQVNGQVCLPWMTCSDGEN
jgi:hypothetical protein